MNKLLKSIIIWFLVVWSAMIVLIVFNDDGTMDLKTLCLGSFLYAIFIGPMVALIIHCYKYNIHVDIKRNKPIDTGLISCKKCGYLGAGTSGFCQRCGWNWTEKITSETSMVSCPKCGYLGAGVPGHCTRCGYGFTVRISK